MNFCIKESISKSIDELDKIYTQLENELERIETLNYMRRDKDKMKQTEQNKYKDRVCSICKNFKMAVREWLKTDAESVTPIKGDITDYYICILTDFTMINSGYYLKDEDYFSILNKYFGDFEIMKRFVPIKFIQERAVITAYILNKCIDFDVARKNIIAKYNKYLDSIMSIFGSNQASIAHYRFEAACAKEELMNTHIPNFIKVIEFYENIKNKDFDLIQEAWEY